LEESFGIQIAGKSFYSKPFDIFVAWNDKLIATFAFKAICRLNSG
jgi:hypothetical protein